MSYSHQELSQIWAKGKVVAGYDSNQWRKDDCGAWINWSQHGNRKSDVGWEVDHILAVANGGSDSLYNLRPLHWQNNAHKQDGGLGCVVTAKA